MCNRETGRERESSGTCGKSHREQSLDRPPIEQGGEHDDRRQTLCAPQALGRREMTQQTHSQLLSLCPPLSTHPPPTTHPSSQHASCSGLLGFWVNGPYPGSHSHLVPGPHLCPMLSGSHCGSPMSSTEKPSHIPASSPKPHLIMQYAPISKCPLTLQGSPLPGSLPTPLPRCFCHGLCHCTHPAHPVVTAHKPVPPHYRSCLKAGTRHALEISKKLCPGSGHLWPHNLPS